MVARWSEAPPASVLSRARMSDACWRASASAGSTHGSLRWREGGGSGDTRRRFKALQEGRWHAWHALHYCSRPPRKRRHGHCGHRSSLPACLAPCPLPPWPLPPCPLPPCLPTHPPVRHAAGHGKQRVQAGKEHAVQQQLAQRGGQRQRGQVAPQAGEPLPLPQRPNVLQKLPGRGVRCLLSSEGKVGVIRPRAYRHRGRAAPPLPNRAPPAPSLAAPCPVPPTWMALATVCASGGSTALPRNSAMEMRGWPGVSSSLTCSRVERRASRWARQAESSCRAHAQACGRAEEQGTDRRTATQAHLPPPAPHRPQPTCRHISSRGERCSSGSWKSASASLRCFEYMWKHTPGCTETGQEVGRAGVNHAGGRRQAAAARQCQQRRATSAARQTDCPMQPRTWQRPARPRRCRSDARLIHVDCRRSGGSQGAGQGSC